MIYDNKYIPIAIRPNAKLGKLTVSLTGKYYAYDAGLDGFNLVEVKPQQLTVTERDFLCGNLLKETIVADETVTKFVTPLTNTFPNLRFVVITYTGGVAEGLDTSFAGLSVTFVVPNSLLSDYQSAYPSLTFTSWNFQQEFTIPYIGDSELTIEYVSLVCSGASGDIQTVDKVIVPPEFTSFEPGVFDYVFLRFSNCEEIEYGSRLPSTYQEVEYIESSGTQYIDTNFYPTNSTRVVIDFSYPQAQTANIIGCRTSANNKEYQIQIFDATYPMQFRFGDTWFGTGVVLEVGNYVFDASQSGFYSNSSLLVTPTEKTFTTEYSLFICALNNGGAVSAQCSATIRSVKIYESGILVRDLVPCVRDSDNAVGLYDLVNGVFYANAGTGTFTKGNDVPPNVVARPALSTCTIYYDSDTPHTLTPEIVQATLTEVPEFASCEKVIVPEWFTTVNLDAIEAIVTLFQNAEYLQYGNGNETPIQGISTPFADTLDGNTWGNVAFLLQLGVYFQHFSIDDTKSVTLTNGDTYDTFICDTTAGRYDYSDDSGSSHYVFKFKQSIMSSTRSNDASWANDTLNTTVCNTTIYGLLPNDLKAAIKQVKVSSADHYGVLSLSNNYLFLPSNYEIFGAVGLGWASEQSPRFTQYAAHDSSDYRVTRNLSGTALTAWLRSPQHVVTNYCVIMTNGDSYGEWYRASLAVSPCFVIA